MYYSMKTLRLKKGDTVKILIGKDSGKTGVVEQLFATEKKVLVKGINMFKKHVKPSQKYPSGGIIDINKALDISNVLLVCPNCGKTTRIEYSIEKDAKIRTCKKCQKSVEIGAK
ncbi:MAG: 50S ribosomal protein L24 [bacterium ADurb.Bin212]|nr:MAG: 50S ribosomal protein L24 [bacterium ADurb.Bin212]